MARAAPHVHDTHGVRQYLQHLQRVLSVLRADCLLRPLNPEGTGMCRVAVDWSEVHAYIFQGPAPVADPLNRFFPPELVEAAHQAGLTVLFERLEEPVLLLPPYLQELRNFIDLVRSQREILDLINSRYHDQQIGDLYPKSSVARQLETFAEEWVTTRKGRRRPPTDEDLRSYIRDGHAAQSLKQEIEPRTLKAWLESEYGVVFYLSRIFSSDAIRTLRSLLYGVGGGVPRICAMRDSLRGFTFDVDSAKRAILRWHRALCEARVNDRSQKKEEARHWDAVALEYVARLNAWLALCGEQVLFVSRGRDLAQVIRQCPSHFACTLGPYPQLGRDRAPPLCLRGWYHFFELGIALSTADSPGDRSRVVEDRLQAVTTQLEWLETGAKTARQILRLRESDLRDKTRQNREVFTSTLRTLSPMRKDSVKKQDLLALFVQHVTSAPEFEQERKEICDSIDRNIHGLQEVLDLFYAEGKHHRLHHRTFLDIVRATLRDVPDEKLRSIAPDARMQRALSGLRAAVISSAVPARLSPSLVKTIQSLHPGALEISDGNVSKLLIQLLTAHALGAPRTVRYLVATFEDVIAPGLTLPWVLARVIDADAALSEALDPRDAASLLQQSWFAVRDHVEDVPSGRHEFPAMILLNNWLRVLSDWLDTAVTYGIGQPQHGEVMAELRLVLEQISRISARTSISDWPKQFRPFARSLVNNRLYGYAHLSWHSLRTDDHHAPLEILGDKAQTLCRSLRRAYVANGGSDSEADTLGWALLMMAACNREGGSRSLEHAREARKYLLVATEAEDHRTVQTAELHLDILLSEFPQV